MSAAPYTETPAAEQAQSLLADAAGQECRTARGPGGPTTAYQAPAVPDSPQPDEDVDESADDDIVEGETVALTRSR